MGKSNASVQAHGGSASNICHFSFWKIRGYRKYNIQNILSTTCFEKGAGGGMMGLGRGGRRWMREQEGHSKWPKPPAGSTMFWSAPHFINICAKASATVGGCATIQRVQLVRSALWRCLFTLMIAHLTQQLMKSKEQLTYMHCKLNRSEIKFL